MSLTVKWANGVAVEYDGTRIIFDPNAVNPRYPNIFITHAHQDHARGFEFRSGIKYSTSETRDFIEAIKNKQPLNWRPIIYGQSVRIGDLEIEALNAGHVLGSAQYKVTSPEGVLVYTGDINTVDTLTNKPADVVPCDVLIIETTFGSPEFVFPPEPEVSAQIIRWALNTLQRRKIPTLQCDHIGNAQELIKIFNSLTTVPVVTHPTVTRMNKVYESYGHKLSYLDAETEEAKKLLSSRRCVFIAPKRLDLRGDPNLEVALASGLALRLGWKGAYFPLSDHADFNHLLEYVKRSRPSLVLTCHGGMLNSVFAKYVHEKLKIEARPLEAKPTILIPREGLARIKACERAIMMVMRMPGFNYPVPWIVEQVKSLGFSEVEVRRALKRLTEKGALRNIHKTGGYELKNS